MEEVEADLRDHIAHERAGGTSERRIALALASRMARGAAADAAWRRQSAGRARGRLRATVLRPGIRVLVVTVAVLLFPLLATPSGGASWSVADFVFAAALLGGTGLLLELALSRPRSLVHRVVAVAIGAAAIAFGNADDAPGLVGFGFVLIGAALFLTVRTLQRDR